MESIDQFLIQEELGIQISPNADEFRSQLIKAVQRMIDKDFSSLIQLLYRIDVPEKKLKLLLTESPADQSATIIADAIIERETEKAITRNRFSQQNSVSEEERW